MIEGITIGQIAAFILLLSPVAALFLWLFRLARRFERLEKQAEHRQEDMAVVLASLQGCLKGLIEAGANGPVKDALKVLDHYMANKAAGLHGNGSNK